MAVIKLGHQVVGVTYNPSPSNAADVLTVLGPLEIAGHGTWSIQSETGGVLTIRRTVDGGATYQTMGSVASGQWVIRDQNNWSINPPVGYFSTSFIQASQMAADQAATPEFAAAVAAQLAATAFVVGSSLLANVATGTPAKTSGSVVTVPVTNSGLVTLNNMNVIVHCTY